MSDGSLGNTHVLPAYGGKPELKIHTHLDYKPIPDRNFDWTAVTDDYDGAEDAHHPMGFGATECAAIADLLAQLIEG